LQFRRLAPVPLQFRRLAPVPLSLKVHPSIAVKAQINPTERFPEWPCRSYQQTMIATADPLSA